MTQAFTQAMARSSEDAGNTLGPAADAREHVDFVGLGGHGVAADAGVVVAAARVVARAAGHVAVDVVFADGRVGLVVGGEEVSVQPRVHRPILLRCCCDQTALAAHTRRTVGPRDVVETDVPASGVERDRVCASEA